MLYAHSSLSGGTGSGYGNRILEYLEEYKKKPKIYFQVVPTIKCDYVVAPFNCLAAMAANQKYSNLNILFDNESLYKNWSRNMGDPVPTFNNSGCKINDLLTNLLPFPKLNSIIPSFKGYYGANSNEFIIRNNLSAGVLAEECFDPNNYLLNIEERVHILSSNLQYQGPTISLSQITKI